MNETSAQLQTSSRLARSTDTNGCVFIRCPIVSLGGFANCNQCYRLKGLFDHDMVLMAFVRFEMKRWHLLSALKLDSALLYSALMY